MKKLLLSLGLLLIWLPVFSQKGITPLSTNSTNSTISTAAGAGLRSVTRAVVVGISDYQSPAIPDLQSANRDAEAFAAWLKSPAGGSLQEGNVNLLVNEKATSARFDAALNWLIDESKEGDEALIYFSGHGDVETKTMRQNGFLLCWDSPPTGYAAGGAYALYFLEDVINTLSLQNKAHVVVIADACHAGKLAGSGIGGAGITGLNLAKQFAGEVKIMSCQPTEFSLEGPQWGGGRGVFSYHLVEGLTGLSDGNGDGVVNLFEIGRYLEDHVTAEAAPHQQMPMVVGDKTTPLAHVDATALAALQESKRQMLPNFAATKSKGFEDAFLSKSDSSLEAQYQAFLAALEQHRLLEPDAQGQPCANNLYDTLIRNEQLKPLHNLMRRNFAAALQDEVQQAINALMESDPSEVSNWNSNPAHYALFPRYLQRAIDLLGREHYTYPSLLSKKRFFEAYLLSKTTLANEESRFRQDSVREVARHLLDEAIALEPAAAYLYHAVARLYLSNNPYRTDSVELYTKKALERSPNWLLPYLDLTMEYQWVSDYRIGEKWLLKAADIAPESYVVLERLSWLRQWQNRTDESIQISKKMIAMRPELFSAYSTLGKTYWMRAEYGKGLEWIETGMKTSPLSINSFFNNIAELYAMNLCGLRRVDEAISFVDDLWTRDSVDLDAKFGASSHLEECLFFIRKYDDINRFAHLADSLNGFISNQVISKTTQGKVLAMQGKWDEAERILRFALTVDPFQFNSLYASTYAWLGFVEQHRGNPVPAEALFKKALTMGVGNFMDDCSVQEETCFLYGRFLLDQNRLAEADSMFQKAVKWRLGHNWMGYYGLSVLAAKKGRQSAALDYLERALDRHYPIPEPIFEESLFEKIRKTKRFKALISKHFSEY